MRAQHLRKFIENTRNNRAVDPRKFWELRDLYDTGMFRLSIDHTTYRESQSLSVFPRNQVQAIARYDGKRINSTEYLIPTQKENALDIVSQPYIPPERLIFRDSHTKLFFTDPNTLTVAFSMPIEEIARANGVFGLNTQEIDKLSGFSYANVTNFTLDCCQGFIKEFSEATAQHP